MDRLTATKNYLRAAVAFAEAAFREEEYCRDNSGQIHAGALSRLIDAKDDALGEFEIAKDHLEAIKQ